MILKSGKVKCVRKKEIRQVATWISEVYIEFDLTTLLNGDGKEEEKDKIESLFLSLSLYSPKLKF